MEAKKRGKKHEYAPDNKCEGIGAHLQQDLIEFKSRPKRRAMPKVEIWHKRC